MAKMMGRLHLPGATEAVNILGPANAAAVTIVQMGPQNGAAMFKGLGPEFAGKLLFNLGPQFVAAMMRAPGHVMIGQLMQALGPSFAAAMFKITGMQGSTPLRAASHQQSMPHSVGMPSVSRIVTAVH